ncbi:2-hydroxyacid dehydrogenase [Janibacter sp. G1551]|uniref:2-hydroxyacid dehydrogenase n=1 Tax=Janibacter sp. G1551 TaxID=3420440 RepID=UPI003CFFFDE9
MVVVSIPDSSMAPSGAGIEGIETVVWDLSGIPPRAGEIEVVVAPYMTPKASLAAVRHTPNARLVQLQSAGYEGIPEVLAGIGRADVALANAAGVHDASTAELAVGLAITALRGLDEHARAQVEGRWERPHGTPSTSLADRRALVVGYGSVGRAIAARLIPFEVAVTAVATRARAGDDLVERVHGTDELPALLPEHDLVVVVVPLTEDTRHLVDEAFLSALPDGALVVNVARGQVADTDAILAHAGRLRFALDVTDPEPLPADHDLWRAPGVVITPHVGGASTAMAPRMRALLRRQLEVLAAGGSALNVVHGDPGALGGSGTLK